MKLILILASLLVGCASQTDFNIGTSKQEKYSNDSIECESETQKSGFYGGVIGTEDMEAFFKKCMATKGWVSAQPIKSK